MEKGSRMAKKFILIPDSFKGTMSSAEVCALMREQIAHFYPEAETVSVPVADGGEGTVDALLAAAGGRKVASRVSGPFFEPMDVCYGVLDDGSAVIETASCAGLPLAENRLDPLAATTYGVGEQMARAVRSGSRSIIVGLGGSCTNDGGAGLAAALGVKFYDADGCGFVPTGGTLSRVERIDCSGAEKLMRGVTVTAMCDIDNPLCGPDGAACVFAPQKGADEAAVSLLDEGLRHLADVVRTELGAEVAEMPGAGAAGGLGAGLKAFLGAELRPGIETVLDAVRFEEMLRGASLVFTGEGRLDAQSLRGKTVVGVARRARKAGVPVVAVAGGLTAGAREAYGAGVTAMFSINRTAAAFEEARPHSRENLSRTMEDILRLLLAAHF